MTKIFDILDKLDFFNQRAGRELWQIKPESIQDKDIQIFSSDIKKIRDFITRQQAEIERLQTMNQSKLETIHDLQTEIENLKIELSSMRMAANSYKMHYEDGKSEAVKEFAERLKNEIINDTAFACDISQHTGYYDYKIKIGEIPEYIDSIVKEMVGESNEV